VEMLFVTTNNHACNWSQHDEVNAYILLPNMYSKWRKSSVQFKTCMYQSIDQKQIVPITKEKSSGTNSDDIWPLKVLSSPQRIQNNTYASTIN
jgi:hypothetical protein